MHSHVGMFPAFLLYNFELHVVIIAKHLLHSLCHNKYSLWTCTRWCDVSQNIMNTIYFYDVIVSDITDFWCVLKVVKTSIFDLWSHISLIKMWEDLTNLWQIKLLPFFPDTLYLACIRLSHRIHQSRNKLLFLRFCLTVTAQRKKTTFVIGRKIRTREIVREMWKGRGYKATIP